MKFIDSRINPFDPRLIHLREFLVQKHALGKPLRNAFKLDLNKISRVVARNLLPSSQTRMVSWQGQSPATIFLPSYFIFYRHECYKATRKRETMSEQRELGRTCKSSSRVSAVDAYFFRGTRLDRGQVVLTRAQKGEEGAVRIHRVGDYQCNAVLSLSLSFSCC